jgi:transcriptional regulator with XRE-family HTH domain
MNLQVPSQAQIARECGISNPLVTKYKKRGAPTHSVEAFRAWLAVNVNQSKALDTAPGPDALEDRMEEQPAEVAEVLQTPVPEQVASINAQLKQTETILKWTQGMIAKLNRDGNIEAARKWLHSYALVSKKMQEIQDKLVETRIKCGELVRYAVAKDMVASPLRRLRASLVKMPHELAGRCNPQNPEQAKDAINEWCANFFREESQYEIH